MITIVANPVPSKNTNNVWVVSIEGLEESRQFCKSPYKAMRYMFLLKSRTEGSNISKECLKALSLAIKEQKAKEHPEYAEAAAKIQEVAASIAEAHDINKIKEKKEKKAKSAEAPAEKPAPKKRGRKPKAEKAA